MNRSSTFALLALFAVVGYLLWQSYLYAGELALADERLGGLEIMVNDLAGVRDKPGQDAPKPKPAPRTRKPKETP